MATPNRIQYGIRWSTGGNGDSCPSPIRLQVESGKNFNITGETANFRIQPGDPLKRVANGYVDVADAGEATDYIMVGVGNSGQVYDSSKERYDISPGGVSSGRTYPSDNFRTEVLVVPVNNSYFEIDVDTSGVTQDSRADFRALEGQNADIVFEADTSTLSLNPKLDLSTVGSASAQWRIVNVSLTENNADFSQPNVKLVIQANESTLPPFSTTGV